MTQNRIKEFLRGLRGRLASRDGSVALEYTVLLIFCVGCYMCWLEIFEPGVGFTEYGKQFTAFYQRILVGISLPVP